jgi:anti-sigma-K factor RskA
VTPNVTFSTPPLNDRPDRRPWDSARLWRLVAIVLATTGLALLVAATIAREAPDFSDRPVIAVLRDNHQRAVWTVRLARAAHQIAVEVSSRPVRPSGKDYQLWLAAPGQATQPLGLLPSSGRKIFAETPTNIAHMAGGAELWVTLEPVTGSLARAPGGPVLFRAYLDNRD